MESSSRMRRCLRRNYQGSAHLGATANYEDDLAARNEQGIRSASNASITAAEAISADALIEDDENHNVGSRGSDDFDREQEEENHPRQSEEAELPKQPESNDAPVITGQDLTEDTSAVAPGYVPSELDERIMLELPSSIVRPLRVVRGTFQASWATCWLAFSSTMQLCLSFIKKYLLNDRKY